MSYRTIRTVTLAAAAVSAVAVAGAPNAARADEVIGTSTQPLTSSVDVRVVLAGAGRGTVDGSGFDCGRRCSVPFGTQETVSLRAHALPGSRFDRWVGACGQQPQSTTCTFDAGDVSWVQAVFAPSVTVGVRDAALTISSHDGRPARRFDATYDVAASSFVTYELRAGGVVVRTWRGSSFSGHSRRGIWFDDGVPAGSYELRLGVTTGSQVQWFSYRLTLGDAPAG